MKTRKPEDLHEYQKRAVNFQVTNPHTMIWMDPGLGKTAVTLTSVKYLLEQSFVHGVLVVAPLRVCRLVWTQEAKKWAHTHSMTFSMIMGTKDQRIRALMKKSDIYITNYENIGWLSDALHQYFISKGKALPFNGVIWDEVSKMKNSNTQRVRSIRKILSHLKWTTGLTGTPASNGYKDLHGQFLVVDKGKRLGTSKTAFKTMFYYKVGPYLEVPFSDTEGRIKNLIGDITLEMSAEDFNPLPDIIYNNVQIDLPEELREKYENMEKELWYQFDNGDEMEIFNQAALTNKCLQFSNGALYPMPGVPLYQTVHDLKLEALDEILDETGEEPILLAYGFKSDATRLMERYKHLRPINLTTCKSDKSLNDAMTRWANRDCKLMIGHPSSMAHGIDGLQACGSTLVWFGLNWSLDLYDQFNARIRRQGQGKPVICHRLITRNTLDDAQVLALELKSKTQKDLRKAVLEYRQAKRE